ncbi:MAG: hypothetical protein AVDCRST_MAG77-935 [uncultured Chloroflexi bacterium]|uniref:Uncharacterized protein n=1 Tax=uncultured Chloroflexota bacterium TaxID=166587 RepID=A0A6J4HRD5_9CHLR|nr:MAG: hypothetical protein AVDCRST_MAG77-935 [uncultured Chloroflexota bacterium]
MTDTSAPSTPQAPAGLASQLVPAEAIIEPLRQLIALADERAIADATLALEDALREAARLRSDGEALSCELRGTNQRDAAAVLSEADEEARRRVETAHARARAALDQVIQVRVQLLATAPALAEALVQTPSVGGSVHAPHSVPGHGVPAVASTGETDGAGGAGGTSGTGGMGQVVTEAHASLQPPALLPSPQPRAARDDSVRAFAPIVLLAERAALVGSTRDVQASPEIYDAPPLLPAAEVGSRVEPAASAVVPERSAAGTGEARPTPGGAIDLVAGPFSHFSDLAAFTRQLRAMPGVDALETRQFYKGTVRFRLRYDDPVPFVTRVGELHDFAPHVVATDAGRIEVRVTPLGGEDEADSPLRRAA